MQTETESYTTLQESMIHEGKELTKQRLFLQSLVSTNIDKTKLKSMVHQWIELRSVFATYEEYTAKVNSLGEQIALMDALGEKISGTKIRSFNTAMEHQKKSRTLYFEKHLEYHLLVSSIPKKEKKSYSPTKGFR
uniref:Uncharacterized protein n=1 Tax=viral metagenome TaxID=1070528 RepID=A0A6C0D0I9_9ZZZZ